MVAAEMSALETVGRIVAGLILILANGFFVAIEFALTRARQFTEEEFVDSSALERAWEMTNQLEIYLTSCQVGITASSIALGIVAEPAIAALFESQLAGTPLAALGLGAAGAFIIINLVHLTHGEQTPTYLGVERSKFVCRYGAAPLYWFTRIIRPIISVGDTVAKWTLGLFGVEMTGAWLEAEEDVIESRADLRTELSDMLERGNLPSERQQEVLAALDVDETPVSEEMVPRENMVVLSTEVSSDENKRRINDSTYTRYPLVGESIDDVKGMVYMPELARFSYGADKDVELEDIASPPMTLDANTSISVAIDQFQVEEQEIALVVDDSGKVVGLITVTDALEELVGEIEDPLDHGSEYEKDETNEVDVARETGETVEAEEPDDADAAEPSTESGQTDHGEDSDDEEDDETAA